MNCEFKILDFGAKKLEYTLFLLNRKTLEIAVHPDGSLVIKAPIGTDLQVIEKRIRKRIRWIIKQKQYFNQFVPRTPEKRYVGGETHLYLGRQYRLKVSVAKPESVKLTRGFFHISCSPENEPEKVMKLLEKWYRNRAAVHFNDCLERSWPAFEKLGFTKPAIKIKKMRRRWGSLTNGNTMTLNSELIKAPRECIDYVIIHELCHLKHKNHDAEFYRMLESHLPDWEKVKHRLELALV
ncbi:MAG: SprT family zinc-dependent metalloprotease [Bacteroidales bacterium]|jgi:predicted metal-dependent hydrolase|nr:SprT family zinc-dependent metalloprotease [Bacteroidales bacterium]